MGWSLTLGGMEKCVIVNADDFGFCGGVNKAIEKAYNDGVLTSTTIMAGADGIQEAVEMAKSMPRLGVGVHLNLVQGKAVSQSDKTKCLIDENGELKYSPVKIAVKSMLCGKIREAIEIELTAQVQSVIDMGIKPTHFDSHKHVHTFPSIYSIVVKVAEKFGIGAIRWPGESGKTCNSDWPLPSKGGKNRTLKVSMMARMNRVQNRKYIKNDAFFGVAHTGAADDEFWKAVCRNVGPGVTEVMVHPGYAEGMDPSKTRLIEERQIELDALCSESTKKAIAEAGIKLVSYGEILSV